MTQLFTPSPHHPPNRNMTLTTPTKGPGSPSPATHFGSASKDGGSASSHMASKLRNFFRINSSVTAFSEQQHHGSSSSTINANGSGSIAGSNSALRPPMGKRIFTRNRSTSSASQLDHAADISPTANANPYFAHQGQPALRHYNHDSAPSSPPDTPALSAQSPAPAATSSDESGKAELARKLRRVASAPNAQGMFKVDNGAGEIPDMPPIPTGTSNGSMGNLLIPSDPALDRLRGQAFRRTYSSNSIKIRDVEVGPGSFDKIKLLGKGDVGKVYLVREKKSSRLYAMKGGSLPLNSNGRVLLTFV